MAVVIGDYVRASYDFPGEAASDLPLSIGDVVRVTNVVDKNWAVGQKVGRQSKTGAFPLAFVEHLSLPSVRTGQKVFLAIQDFRAEQNGDLELNTGDIVLGLESVDESWWKGKNGPLKGIFPLTMVIELEVDGGLTSRSASARSSGLKLRSDSVISQSDIGSVAATTSQITFARALVDVTPQLDGELAFQLGDLIEITDILDDDWFYGRCYNKQGLVSAVCVELLDECGEANELCHDSSNPALSSSPQDPPKVSESFSIKDLESDAGNAPKGSYTSENTRSHDVEITPYGRVIYSFTAQIPTELSLTENSIVTLIQHVDSDWTEGEVDGRRGLFPRSFIEIIVDCPYAYSLDTKENRLSLGHEGSNTTDNSTTDASLRGKAAAAAAAAACVPESDSKSWTVDESSAKIDNNGENIFSFSKENIDVRAGFSEVLAEHHEIGLVLFSFTAEAAGDISVSEGDTVEVIRHLNENWLQVQTESGQIGQVPVNHVEIIGSWPKSGIGLADVSKSPSPSAERSQEVSENANSEQGITTKDTSPAAHEAGDILRDQNFSSQYSTAASAPSECLTPAAKSSMPSRSKPPLLPKPALSPKPLLSPKPSVIAQHSFMTAKPSLSSRSKTRVPLLENRTSSLTALDALIEGEMYKAKSGGFSNKSDIHLNSDDSSYLNPDDVQEKDSHEHSPQEVSVVSNGSNHISDTKLELHGITSERVSPDYVNCPAENPSILKCEQQRSRYRQKVFSSSVSFSGEETAKSDACVRRKSASFAERGSSLSTQNSTFVNRAFQMDVPEGALVDLNANNGRVLTRIPARPAPPRPVSAIVASSVSQTAPMSPGKIKAPPPRPTGPRMAAAPSRTPLVPMKAEPVVKLVPKRPAPRAPVSRVQSVNAAALQSSPHSTPSRQRRHSPKPGSVPADLISFSPDGPNEEDNNKELVADLRSKLKENQVDIKKYEQTRSDLQKNLAQADTQNKEAEIKDNLEFADRQLLGLQEEERRLKENLFAISRHDAKLEQSRLLAAQHAEEEEKRKEEERKREAETREKRKDQREKIIGEIVDTEKDYLLSMQLCLETFLDGQKPPAGVDLNFLLGNMEEIADVSQKMLVHLETCVSGKSFDEQYIGKCFTDFAEDMKNTYAPYCRNHDDVLTAMERYTENTEVSDYFNVKLEKMREQMNVFDVAGVLIKPVQRILKYPLLLNELLKNTEEDHPDKKEIIVAIRAMTDVAKAVNEYKRRKDLVYKYKKFTDKTFSDKISKLNFHSIRKKSTRIKGRLTTNFGIALQMRDESFEREEAKFHNLERAVKVFLRSVNHYLEQSQETMQCLEIVVEGIKDFYRGKECVEATKLHEVTVTLLGLFDTMKEVVENVVVASLNTLVGLFNAPAKVIEKRFDKLLDYNSQLGKAESDKELQAARNDYEAMNAQLLDELPQFYNLAFKMLRHCIAVFVLARRDFTDQSLKESCVLLALPFMASKANLMETFKTRHMTVLDSLSLLSFIPRGFNPRVDAIKADRAKQRERAAADSLSSQQQQNTSASSQSESQKKQLQEHYPASKLYVVTSSYSAADVMDISLMEGSLVGVLKELDPMGKKERWFVDDGARKGFVPCSILTLQANVPPNTASSSCQEEDLISILSDDCGGEVLLAGGDVVQYHAGGSSEESYPQPQQETYNEYYYALYDFKARHQNETTLVAGHPVTIIAFHDVDGNAEWWLVESEGNRGYAPASYMAPIPYS